MKRIKANVIYYVETKELGGYYTLEQEWVKPHLLKQSKGTQDSFPKECFAT